MRSRPDLLGCVLEHETAVGWSRWSSPRSRRTRGEADPASHAFRGRTAAQRGDVRPARARVRVLHLRHALLREPGLPAAGSGVGGAAAGRRVIDGGRSRPARRDRGRADGRGLPDRDLARGPARLCQALGIDRSLDGADVCDPRPRCGSAPPAAAAAAGSSRARGWGEQRADVPWRFWLDGRAHRVGVPAARPAPRESSRLGGPDAAPARAVALEAPPRLTRSWFGTGQSRTTTFPLVWPCSTWERASAICGNGKTWSITGFS